MMENLKTYTVEECYFQKHLNINWPREGGRGKGEGGRGKGEGGRGKGEGEGEGGRGALRSMQFTLHTTL